MRSRASHRFAEFITPRFCADHIMDQLYDGPGPDPWVVVEQENGICFPCRLNVAMDGGDKYHEISWDVDGNMVLEVHSR